MHQANSPKGRQKHVFWASYELCDWSAVSGSWSLIGCQASTPGVPPVSLAELWVSHNRPKKSQKRPRNEPLAHPSCFFVVCGLWFVVGVIVTLALVHLAVVGVTVTGFGCCWVFYYFFLLFLLFDVHFKTTWCEKSKYITISRNIFPH